MNSFAMNIKFFQIATFSYVFAMVFYLTYLAFRSKAVGKIASGITYLGFAFHTISIGLRWWESYQMGAEIGHIPISNLFESMSLGAWTIILLYVIIEAKYKNRSFGAFVMPVAALAMAYIGVAPNIGKDIEPLVPALKSYWLHIHVLTSFLGYAAFAISFSTSFMYLIINTKERDAIYVFWTLCIGAIFIVMIAVGIDALVLTKTGGEHMLEGTFRSPIILVRILSYAISLLILFASWVLAILPCPRSVIIRVLIFLFISPGWVIAAAVRDGVIEIANFSETLDEVGYKTIAIGFPLLTVGIITGAVWANKAWGTYWGWDPKETWSLITWLMYAAYLHARFTRGWKGKRAAVLSMVGFLAVIFTYLGVNLLLSGLHSYGSAD